MVSTEHSASINQGLSAVGTTTGLFSAAHQGTVTPKITVVIPTYNRAQTLAKAIDSILNQTESDFELLIIDDASTDNTAEVVRQFTDPRIRYIQQPSHRGLVANLNLSLVLGRGQVHARLDDDDWAHPERLAQQWAAMDDQPALGLLGCGLWFCSPSGQRLFKQTAPSSSAAMALALLDQRCIPGCCSFYRPDWVRATGGYGARESVAEDYELNLKLVRVTLLANLPQPLVHYCFAPQQNTRSQGFANVIPTLPLTLGWLESVLRRPVSGVVGFLLAGRSLQFALNHHAGQPLFSSLWSWPKSHTLSRFQAMGLFLQLAGQLARTESNRWGMVPVILQKLWDMARVQIPSAQLLAPQPRKGSV